MNRVPQNLAAWLAHEDEITLVERASRLDFLIKQYGNPKEVMCFWGGPLAKESFEEARWCFVNAQFVGCVLLCQCFLEGTLGGLLATFAPNAGVSNRWLKESGFAELTEKAFESGWLDELEKREFDWLRRCRASYVHPKPPFSRKHVAYRMIEENLMAEELAAQDATRAISLMLRFAQRAPFRIVGREGESRCTSGD